MHCVIQSTVKDTHPVHRDIAGDPSGSSVPPFFPHNSLQCGLIKIQGLSLENFGCAGSCSGRGKGKEKEPLLFSQCTLFNSFSPPFSHRALWLQRGNSSASPQFWGCADRGCRGQRSPRRVRPPRQFTHRMVGTLEIQTGPFFPFTRSHLDLSTNPGHRVHTSNAGFTALNMKQTDISTIIILGAFV